MGITDIKFALPHLSPKPLIVPCTCLTPALIAVKELATAPVSRQEAPEVFDIHASIYIWKRQALLTSPTLFTENTDIYVVPDDRSLDIDTELDWRIVEFLLKSRSSTT